MGKTVDEKFLIKIYEELKRCDDLEAEIDFYSVANKNNIKSHAAKNIVKILAQANFVKKIDSSTLQLTKRGIELVKELKGGHK